jgi:hypothetical protein
MDEDGKGKEKALFILSLQISTRKELGTWGTSHKTHPILILIHICSIVGFSCDETVRSASA